MHSIRTQGGPLMNRLTFPCLSAVVFPPPTGYVACFILSCLKCFKTQRRKRGHGNLLFQSYFLRLLRKPSVHHFNNLSKKCKFFLKFVNFSLKKCQDKVLYFYSFRRMTFLSQLVTFIREKSTGLWQALNGQTQCHKRHHWKKAPWQTYHMWTVTAQSICFSWLFDIPMNLAFQWRAVNQVIEGK